MPNPISHTSKSGTVKVWNDSSVMRYPESERPGGGSYEQTADEYIAEQYNAQKAALDSWISDRYIIDFDNFRAEIPDGSTSGGYMQGADGWFRIWRNNHWHKVYAGEDDGIDAAYRPVWEASGFCLRWDEITEDMLDYDPGVPEFVRFKGADVSLLPGRKFEIGGSRAAYRKFIRWCETAPKPVEVRKDKISSPNDFPVDWIQPKRMCEVYREELDPLHMMQDDVRAKYKTVRLLYIDTSVMVPPSPEICMVIKPLPDPDTDRFTVPSDPSESDRWKNSNLFMMHNSAKITESTVADYALSAYLIIPPDVDPVSLETNCWQDCSVGFILCGIEKIVRISKRISMYSESSAGTKETAIIVIMSRGTGTSARTAKIYANAYSMDFNYVPGDTGWLEAAELQAETNIKADSWAGAASWDYDETKFTPVLNYATTEGSPGFNPRICLFNGYDYYPIRLYNFLAGGVMKNGQRLRYDLRPWYNGEYRLKDVARGDGGTYLYTPAVPPSLMTGPEIPDASMFSRHRVDLTDPSTHHYLSKNDLNVTEGTAVAPRTVWNVIRDSLRPKLYRQGQGGSVLTGQYVDNLWSKYASTYISEASRDWKLVDNTDNPLYTVNGQPGCTKVLHIEETTGNTELNMKVIPIEPNTAYTFSVYCRGNRPFRLFLRTYATHDLARAQGTALFDSYQEFTPTTSWTQVSITSTATAATYASLWIYCVPGTAYTEGDYLEICGLSLTPGTAAQWAPAKGDTWPLPASGSSAYSPDSPSWGDYYQMVRMPNIWCAPYDQDGRHEFWISLSRECPPGMIPWFVNQDENGDWVPAGRYKLFGRYSVRAPKSRSISPDGEDVKYPSICSWKYSGVDIARGSGPIGPIYDCMVPNSVISGDVSWDNIRNPAYKTDIDASFSMDVAGLYNNWINWENSYLLNAKPEFSPATFTYGQLKDMADNANLYVMSYWEYHVFNMIKAAYYGGEPRFDRFLPSTTAAYSEIGGWHGCGALHMRELGQADWKGCMNVDGSLGDTYTEGTGIGYIRDFGFQEYNHNIKNTYTDSFISCNRSLSSCTDTSMGGVSLFMWVEELGSEIQVDLTGLCANCMAAQEFGTYSEVPANMIIPANIANSRSMWEPDSSYGREFRLKTGKSLYNASGEMQNRSTADMNAWGWPTLFVDSWMNPAGLAGEPAEWTRNQISKFDWQASFGVANGRTTHSWFSEDMEYTSFYHWGLISLGSGFLKSTPIICPWSSRLAETRNVSVNGGSASAFCTLDCITEEDLPYDYEVEYLESDGNQWIDTEVSNEGRLAFDCVFKNDSSVSPGFGNVLGAGKSEGIQELQIGNCQGGMVSVGASGGRKTGLGFYPDRLNCVTYNGKQTVTVNRTAKTVTQYTDITQPQSIYLFCINQNGTATMKQAGRIYYVRFGENGRKGDFIPVSRDGVGYMYNKVTGKLHGNKGTGSFKTGPRVIK